MGNEQIKQKMPVGVILILIFIGWEAVSLLFNMFKINLTQLGPIIVSGVGAVFVSLVSIGIFGTIFYGTLKRFRWARKLAIGWYVFLMALTLINLISLLANKFTPPTQ